MSTNNSSDEESESSDNEIIIPCLPGFNITTLSSHCNVATLLATNKSNNYICRAFFGLHIPKINNKFKHEIYIHKKLYKLQLAPYIVDICKSNNNGFIIMEKWDMTLYSYEKLYNNKVHDSLYKIIDKKINLMHKNGIIHGDLHDKNIVLKLRKDSVIDIAFIDFDYSVDFFNEYTENDLTKISELFDLTDNTIETIIEHENTYYLESN